VASQGLGCCSHRTPSPRFARRIEHLTQLGLSQLAHRPGVCRTSMPLSLVPPAPGSQQHLPVSRVVVIEAQRCDPTSRTSPPGRPVASKPSGAAGHADGDCAVVGTRDVTRCPMAGGRKQLLLGLCGLLNDGRSGGTRNLDVDPSHLGLRAPRKTDRLTQNTPFSKPDPRLPAQVRRPLAMTPRRTSLGARSLVSSPWRAPP